MDRMDLAARKVVCLVLVLSGMLPIVGCAGLVANLMHVAGGDLVPAAFPGLGDRRVAVVCVSNSEVFGPTSISAEVGKRVNQLLGQKIPKILLVDQQEIGDWIDHNDWNFVDYQAIGLGVSADLVVAVNIDALSLHEGKTMYKGRADLQVVVYDLEQGGKEVFARTPPQIVFPATGGVSTAEMGEREFRRRFLDVVSEHVGRYFYSFDMKQDYARDATLLTSG